MLLKYDMKYDCLGVTRKNDCLDFAIMINNRKT